MTIALSAHEIMDEEFGKKSQEVCATWHWFHLFSPFTIWECLKSWLRHLASMYFLVCFLSLQLGRPSFFKRWRSSTLLTWQLVSKGEHTTKMCQFLQPKLGTYATSFLMHFSGWSQSQGSPVSKRRKIDSSSQLGEAKNLWPPWIHHNIKPDFRRQGKVWRSCTHP